MQLVQQKFFVFDINLVHQKYISSKLVNSFFSKIITK